MRIFYFMVFLVLVSCNDKAKPETSEISISKEEEKRILKDEIDDLKLEADVVLSRNQTKRYLDFEKAKLIGLTEKYQQEEPYSIVFLDGINFVTYQALKVNSSEIETTIDLFMNVANTPLEIKKTVIGGFNINYAEQELNNKKWIHSVIDIDESDQRIIMQISSEEIIDSEDLMTKYLIVKKIRN